MYVKFSRMIFDIALVLLQLSVIICNGFILFLFIREKIYRQNPSRLLMIFLTTTDFFHAVTTLPLSIYFLCSWDQVYFDLNPYYVLIACSPFIAQLKINLTLTISIAVERIVALSLPAVFRKLSSYSYATFCLLFGISVGVFDVILELSLSNYMHIRGCGNVGCFLNVKFCYYWLISNMVMSITVISLTTLILLRLQAIHQKPQPGGSVILREMRFKQANRNCAGILLISLVFVTLPTIGVGVLAITRSRSAMVLGPFYLLGLLCAGACNSILHATLNKDTRVLIVRCFVPKRHVLAGLVKSTKIASTKFLT